ncbi:hypothetical protein D9613_012278 [Agrocybe pediades]|uniref:Uncharacterized protein n=1 Tax=Agrocybe pediades TaxID=84607 RepID=A0A8H4QEN5_9AGAR|nr:hypothetical protein D9613_012278 [Agrocybe pediades]
MISSPIADCGKFEVAMNGVLMAYVITITFTFYLRIYAIYRDKLFVKVVYGLLWLSVVGVSGTFAKTFSATHLGPTRYCLESVNDKYLQPLAIILLTNDTLIYIGITYRLYTLFLDIESSTQQKLKLVVFGTSLPIFSKAVLQDSQLYFLIIVCTKAFLVYTTRNLSPPMNVMYVICHLVLVNTLSGRIFRTIKMNCDRWERPLEPDIGPGMDFAANSSFGAVQTRTGLAFPSSSGNTGSHSTDMRLDASEKGVPISDLTPSVITLESSMR